MGSSWPLPARRRVPRVVTEDAMSVYQRDADAGQDNPEERPAFRMVRRGYDRAEVDTYMAQLIGRLGEAVDQYAKGEQARAELQREVTNLREGSPSFEQLGGEAAALLQEAGRSAEQLVENAHRRGVGAAPWWARMDPWAARGWRSRSASTSRRSSRASGRSRTSGSGSEAW